MKLQTLGAGICWSCVVFFLLFLLAQHAMLFPGHDDYGVAVLWYVGRQTGFEGQDFALHQVLSFLAHMYEHWSGRVTSLFLLIHALKGGIWFIRLLQVLVILWTLYLMVRIAEESTEHRNNRSLKLMIAATLYMSLPANATLNGIYWFSAASGYLWGIPFFLAGVLIAHQKGRLALLSAFLIAFASSFHELMGSASLAFVLAFTLCNKEWKTEKPFHSLLGIFTVFLFVGLTALAPGNFSRQEKQGSLHPNMEWLDSVLQNVGRVSDLFFSPSMGGLYFCIVCFSTVLFSYFVAREFWVKSAKLVVLAFTIASGFLACLYLVGLHTVFSISLLLLYSLIVFIFFLKLRHCPTIISLHVASLAAIAPLIVAPNVAARSGIPMLLLSFPLLIIALSRLEWPAPDWTRRLVLAGIFLASANVAATTFRGVAANYDVNARNHSLLLAAGLHHGRTGELLESITLYKPPRRQYATTKQPYERPLIEKWMKQYYRIPQQTTFIWIMN